MLATLAILASMVCTGQSALDTHGRMKIAIRFQSDLDPKIKQGFRDGLDFWSGILDMKWKETKGSGCSIYVYYDSVVFFIYPEFIAFSIRENGAIAWNQDYPPDPDTKATAIHEIGHLFGLQHNPDRKSFMYYSELDGPKILDAADLAELKKRHRLKKKGLDP